MLSRFCGALYLHGDKRKNVVEKELWPLTLLFFLSCITPTPKCPVERAVCQGSETTSWKQTSCPIKLPSASSSEQLKPIRDPEARPPF